MPFKTASLTDTVIAIVKNKDTEYPFTGEYNDFGESGTYLCRQCGLGLFRSTTKFHSGCGWPSFDENIPHAILREPDVDGQRIEILCSRCRAHLGHVFTGENLTAKNTRHCVNSLSLDFVFDTQVLDTEEAIFAAGCFWGVEYYFKRLPGVLKTEVGYIGGNKENPTYQEICSGTTGHYEAIRVVYDPKKINYEQIAKFFFEIHDPTQLDGQGPDRGEQYLSVAFYYNEAQQKILLKLINDLKDKGYLIATKLLPVSTFWRAETYHQDYYKKTDKQPYCHRYQKKFD
jgi:peptide methionine sulfoxide reductase msrA/msrB